jgi:hypothetical protein
MWRFTDFYFRASVKTKARASGPLSFRLYGEITDPAFSAGG